MAARGIFSPGERVELVEGEILEMTPQGSRHTTVVNLFTDALRAAFREGHVIRVQQPLVVDPDGEPEPDVAVVAGTHDDYLEDHPTTAVLVVEVAETSLRIDRRKARVYAAAGVPEYWIANLVDGVLEVHRGLEETSGAGRIYSEVKIVKSSGSVRSTAAPGVRFSISDLFR